MTLPTDAQMRKGLPIWRGVVEYFPDALEAIAELDAYLDESDDDSASEVFACMLIGTREYLALAALNALAMLQTEITDNEPDGDCDPGTVFRRVIVPFADAIAEISAVSLAGADQHCVGVLGWQREKSTDHADCVVRHLLDAGKRDTDGQRHTAKVAWRLLAMLQLACEAKPDATEGGYTIRNVRINGVDYGVDDAWSGTREYDGAGPEDFGGSDYP